MAQNARMIEFRCDELGIPQDIKPDAPPYVCDETALPLQNKRHALSSGASPPPESTLRLMNRAVTVLPTTPVRR